MLDLSRSIEHSKIWPVTEDGIYEVARLMIPSSPLYEIKTIWQLWNFELLVQADPQRIWFSFNNPWWMVPNGYDPNLASIRWALRFDSRSEARSLPMAGPGVAPGDRSIPFEALPAWHDRGFISDNWGSSVRHSLILSGPGALRLFAEVSGLTETYRNMIVGGRLHGVVWEGVKPE